MPNAKNAALRAGAQIHDCELSTVYARGSPIGEQGLQRRPSSVGFRGQSTTPDLHPEATIMIKPLHASVLSLFVLASGAWAQCSPWTNTTGIASNLGGPGGTAVLIDSILSNGAEFLFIASATDGAVALMVESDGIGVMGDWHQDENGIAVMTDNDGLVCRVRCAEFGGIVVSIDGEGSFTPERFAIASTGEAGPKDKCICDGAMFGTWIRDCDEVACDGDWPCRGTQKHPTASCAWVRIIEK